MSKTDGPIDPPDVWDEGCDGGVECEDFCVCVIEGCDVCNMERGCRCDWDYETWKDEEMDWNFD